MRSIFVPDKPNYRLLIGRALRIIVIVGLVIAGGVFLVGLLPESVEPVVVDASFNPVPEADQVRLGDVEFDDGLPYRALPADAAVDIATSEFKPDEVGASRVDPYLATITIPSTEQARTPITDRETWIVRFSGMSVENPGPTRADGTVAPGQVLRNAYVFLDALSGEVLFTRWTE